MNPLSTELLRELLNPVDGPCISLYQPTHRHHPDRQADPIHFRNSVRELEALLKQDFPHHDIREMLQRFHELEHDERFWNRSTDGLAILCSTHEFRLFRLQRPVPSVLVVSDTFHTKPLLRIVQSADRYQLLCVNRQEIRLYQGNRDTLDPVELTNVPTTIDDALGRELTEPHLTVASYGMPGGSGGSMRHGHGAKKDELDIDIPRFFRVVDRAILDHYSRPAELPLILAALPEYHSVFREVSHNPFLMKESIPVDPWALTADQLRVHAWKAVEPQYLARLATLVENFSSARASGLGSDDLVKVAQATLDGRVGTLLVEADRQVPGKLLSSGRVQFGAEADSKMGDILDDMAEWVLRMKGDVVVVPHNRMPTETGAAAIFRYPDPRDSATHQPGS